MGPVVAFGTAGGEDDLVGLSIDALRDHAAGVFDSMAGLLGASMQGRGVGEAVPHERQHRLQRVRVELSRRGVVGIDVKRFHSETAGAGKRRQPSRLKASSLMKTSSTAHSKRSAMQARQYSFCGLSPKSLRFSDRTSSGSGEPQWQKTFCLLEFILSVLILIFGTWLNPPL